MLESDGEGKWEFWIDRGGTFTDVIARQPDGHVVVHKLLSENPEQYRDASIQGIKDILGVDKNDVVPVEKIAAIKMGTTVATNALLERKGEPTLLVTTAGFGDALRIGYQSRPDLFALNIELPEMLYSEVYEVTERVDANGNTLIPLDEDDARKGLQNAYDKGIRSVAIVLMHSYRYADHEARLADLARAIGYPQVSVSHRASPLMKLVSRGDTTVVDAYLSPGLTRYVAQVSEELDGIADQGGLLKFMQSSGGLTDAAYFDGKDAILSGPAGGVVGMARVCEAAGFEKIIGFDMGGTSTDVSHYNGEFEKTLETNVAGVRLRAPMMLIHTVAAGGGSILHFDGARYRVGPDSAGAFPGPASYRNEGPLTVTDCNVMLGKLQPEYFPKIFGPKANEALDKSACVKRFAALAERIAKDTGDDRKAEQVAAGFLAIAVQNMANAVKKISVQRGYDVTEYTLCCFGGAGGQHACLVADALGINRILIHAYAGALSAYGMGLADTIVGRQQAVEAILEADFMPDVTRLFEQLEEAGRAELRQQGEPGRDLLVKRLLHIRYQGSDTALVVKQAPLSEIIEEFERLHQMRFGFISPNKDLIVESVEVEVISPAKPSKVIQTPSAEMPASEPLRTLECFMDDRWQSTPFYERDGLSGNCLINGPAVILDPISTIVVEPGWRCKRTADNNIILERYLERRDEISISTDVDPVMLEIFNNLFMSIAEQMGLVLENTAASVNIKERLDFSCAIFDPTGALIANAPHMPAHLGSMGESIKTVIRDREGDIRPGDAYILNAPYNGGTHLPDITIVKPIFSKHNELLFYVASRGHHTDIGGTTPGSAPANSTSIEEEGVVIDNFKLVENDRFREREIYELLTSNRWPSRNPAMNIADFKAQLAACEKGAQELYKMVDHYGIDTVHSYMLHVQNNAEESVRKVLATLSDGEFSYEMDCGSRICVSITVDQKNREAVVDFSGTSPQHPGNLNAPKAVVYAAVLYTFRCLARDNIPLNEGCLRPIKIVIPEKTMISPEYPGAVISGNTETAQALVGTLFGALKIAASSQGTMNNFIWGNEEHQYYETICGGSGATADSDGTDAVHTHMTNSRLTDPEILEWRFPVILESFKIRKGSGGAGRKRGGDGVIRRVRFLENMKANVLSGHRRVPPYGLEGGESAKVGFNFVEHPDGTVTQLSSMDQIDLQAGDVFVIKTPGGGGYGVKEN
ncbi:MAG: hydantoinase B/oxoprolinase family protein [Woeseia sp.]